MANLLIQVPNIIGILYFSDNMTMATVAKINIITLPLSFTASCLFVMYFMKGVANFSYPILVLMNICATLFVGIIIGVFVLKNQTFNVLDIVGFFIILIGILIIIFKDSLL